MRLLPLCLAVALSLWMTSAATSAPPTVRLRLRVLDQSGKPVAKARAVLFKTTPQSARAARAEAALAIATEHLPLRSGADGIIETPALAATDACVLEIDANGFAPELTRWTPARQIGTVELPAVKLRRLSSLKGTVVNRQGQPVSNVTVIQAGGGPKRLEAVTDGQGHFVLGGVPEGKAVVCFEAAGYRFYGSLLACPSENARIELERSGDSNPRQLKRAAISANEWPAERRSAEAKKLLEPILTAVLAKKTIGEADFAPLMAAARSEPQRVLARINDLKFAQPFRREQIRNMAAFALAGHEKTQSSLESLSKLADPETQINAYLYWFQNNHRNPADLAARRVALKRARDLIAASKDKRLRGFHLCELGTQLWDVGEHDAAREVLNECRALLKEMPADARGRDAFRVTLAMAVARESAAEAKKLADDLDPGQMLRLAGEIARRHPKEAEAFLADVPSELSLMQLRAVGNNLPQVVSRVARQDPAAAERILLKFARPPQAQNAAESIFGLGGGMFNLSKEMIDFQVLKVKAVCFGLIAEAATKPDPSAARRALQQAVDLIRPLRAGFLHPANQFFHTPAVLMILLVPVAERVDPAFANEIYWRALSLRISLPGESYERIMLDVDTPDLVNIVKFYDQPLAAGLLEPVLSRLVSRSYSGMPTYVWPIQSLTLLDPARAVDFPKLLSERASWDGSLPRNLVSQFAASVLANEGLWDKDVGRRLNNQLAHVRNVYGVYIDVDDAGL